MIRPFITHLIYFVLLVLFQVLVLNNIQFSGFVNPYFYILFILLLPFELPGWAVLILSFLLGLTIDSFANTPGMHSSACLIMGFMRHYVLQLIAPRDGYETGSKPRLSQFGFGWFLRYTVMLVLAHHLALFYFEVFSFNNFFYTFFRVIVSSFFTILLIMLAQLLVSPKS